MVEVVVKVNEGSLKVYVAAERKNCELDAFDHVLLRYSGSMIIFFPLVLLLEYEGFDSKLLPKVSLEISR